MSPQVWKEVKHEAGYYTTLELVLQVNYGVKDKKGRELGHTLIIMLDKRNLATKELEKCVIAKAYATRNGIGFGAGFPTEFPQETVEQAKAFLLAKADKFRRDIERKAEKNGGIYP